MLSCILSMMDLTESTCQVLWLLFTHWSTYSTVTGTQSKTVTVNIVWVIYYESISLSICFKTSHMCWLIRQAWKLIFDLWVVETVCHKVKMSKEVTKWTFSWDYWSLKHTMIFYLTYKLEQMWDPEWAELISAYSSLWQLLLSPVDDQITWLKSFRKSLI